jgi:hypothetical protein
MLEAAEATTQPILGAGKSWCEESSRAVRLRTTKRGYVRSEATSAVRLRPQSAVRLRVRLHPQ